MSAHRLPPELLVIILDMCHEMEPFRFPWLASEVCSLWRQVTLNAPTLWTDIRLAFYSAGHMRSQKLADRTRTPEALDAYHTNEVDLVRHQLVRSKDLPLTVSFFTRVDSGPFNSIHEAVNLVFVQNAHRIQDLCASDTCVGFIAIAAAIQHHPMPMPLLRMLDVSTHTLTRTAAERDSLPYHAFRLAPNLVSAEFHDFFPPPSDLCWSHLTDLSISCIEVWDVRKVLPHLNNLVDLKFTTCPMSTPIPPSEMTAVVLPSLLRLSIDCVSSSLWVIDAPNLKTLSLMMWNDAELELVITFLQRSRCANSLHTLELSHLDMSLGPVIPLLSCMPYVRKLDWVGDNPEEHPIPNIIHALALRDDNGRFKCCPRLTQLVLRLPDTHPRHFIDTIEQRWRMTPKDECDTLREVELVFHENFWLEDLWGCEDVFGRRIKGLMEEGMSVDVTYIGDDDGGAWDFFQEIFA